MDGWFPQPAFGSLGLPSLKPVSTPCRNPDGKLIEYNS